MFTAIVFAFCSLAGAASEGLPPDIHDRSLAVLHEALADGKEWVKVHAGEALLWTGHPEGVRESFLQDLPNAGPFYRIGVWRVLAQAASDATERGGYEQKILSVLLDTKAPDRQHAAETLGKLGVASHDAEVVRLAKEETGAFRAMTRWVLANSHDPADEAALAALLDAEDADARGCAAYALRFFKAILPETYAKLKSAGEREPRDSKQRTNILSPWYLHAPKAERPAIRARLIEYADKSQKEDKREMCAALGRVPSRDDVPILVRLLDDPELDARSGAAEALLRIENAMKAGQ